MNQTPDQPGWLEQMRFLVVSNIASSMAAVSFPALACLDVPALPSCSVPYCSLTLQTVMVRHISCMYQRWLQPCMQGFSVSSTMQPSSSLYCSLGAAGSFDQAQHLFDIFMRGLKPLSHAGWPEHEGSTRQLSAALQPQGSRHS